MDRLTPHEIVVMFLALGTLLGSARILGELAKRLNQPAVLGEILAGVLLGPTVLGWISPEIYQGLFPSTGALALVLDGISVLAITLFLLVAGMEVDLTTIWRQGRVAIGVGLSGILFPFAIGVSAALLFPRVMGRDPGADALVFSLFFATALSISALPVIAKTLLDLNLFRTDLGMVVVAAAIFNDLLGWIIFAIILGLMGTGGGEGHGLPIAHTIWMTLAFVALMLTVGRWIIHHILPWIQAHTSWPGGVLSFTLTAALFCAALTEYIGVHAIFGAFLFGVALGDSSHLREETRATIDRFISFFFAPLFFASIGLKVNFVTHFDWLLVTVVLCIASAGKIVGCGLGGRWGGLPWRESWAVGFGMNARGAMEIILGLVALQVGLISERLFVALVVMALATSIISGPMMQRLLRDKKPLRFTTYLTAKSFVAPLQAADRWEAIDRLSAVLAEAHGLDEEVIRSAVRVREQFIPTGMTNGIAVPHARIPSLTQPILAIGISEQGIDFDSRDGEPARLILMLLTPSEDEGAQIQILADIARSFASPRVVDQALASKSYREFLALINTAEGSARHSTS
ncbi:MAG: cation:proton antiporter [Bradymonadales bacterium]|nr:cation:proton antiporter [Bradymonadales bacterium]